MKMQYTSLIFGLFFITTLQADCNDSDLTVNCSTNICSPVNKSAVVFRKVQGQGVKSKSFWANWNCTTQSTQPTQAVLQCMNKSNPNNICNLLCQTKKLQALWFHRGGTYTCTYLCKEQPGSFQCTDG